MNSILSSREKKIILAIIRSPQGVTIQEISNEVGVSRRTILREMASVYKWFEKRGYEVERSSSKGLSLSITESDKNDLLHELNEEHIIHYYNKKERNLYIITELLQSKETLKLSYFSKVLDVSEATISTDLNRVEVWLKDYDLSLERKQGYGIEVIGREKNKRRALVSIMYEMLEGNQLRSAVKQHLGIDENQVKITSKVRINLLNLIDIKTINLIEKAIKNSEADMGFKFAESSYTALAVHLALAVKRIQNNENINISTEVLTELEPSEEYSVANKLVIYLEKELNIRIPKDEVAYVTLHLKGARYKNGIYDSNFIKFNEKIISNYELTSIINRMIQIASEETGYNLKHAESLLVGLVDHLRPAINRIQLNLDIRNPLLDKIKEDYADIFETSIKACVVLKEALGIDLPESEIGFIAMHLGSAIEQLKRDTDKFITKYNIVVTCISGIGTSKMLAERLKKEFNNLNIVEVFASTSVNNNWLKRNDIDLILSTVHFENSIIPVLTVNPLLLDKDIKKIKQKLNTIKLVKKEKVEIEEDFMDHLIHIKMYSEAIIELLDNLIIDTGNLFDDYQSMIDYISRKISPNFLLLKNDLIKREDIGKINFQEDRVAFLHARSDSVKKIFVGVFRNKEYIYDKEFKYDTVLVIVAPKTLTKHKLDVVGEISSLVVTDDLFLNDLRKMSESSLYKKIQKALKKFFNKINK